MAHCGREDNTLTHNLVVMLSSTEMIAVTRLWSILHIAIVALIRWLARETHKLAEWDWGHVLVSRVLDKSKDDSESIVDDPELIPDESFITGLMDEFADELPPLKAEGVPGRPGAEGERVEQGV